MLTIALLLHLSTYQGIVITLRSPSTYYPERLKRTIHSTPPPASDFLKDFPFYHSAASCWQRPPDRQSAQDYVAKGAEGAFLH